MRLSRNIARISGLAALALMLAVPAAGPAQTPANGVNSQNGGSQNMSLVGTRAAIEKTLDAKDAQPGQTFKARLADKAKMDNGQVLPKGTVLIGKVAQDDTNQKGNTKLALSIEQAQMKDGKTVPVHAYIVGLYPAGDTVETQATAVVPGNQGPNPWKPGIQKVDQIDALSGVDLHSQIGDKNSAVLVSSKSDIKLKTGTELALAIGPGNGSSGQGNGGGR